jgi:hypothetical protein
VFDATSRALSVVLCAVAVSSAAAAGLKVDGDAKALTLVSEGAPRSEIVAAIAQHFNLEPMGSAVDDDIVSGRFSGSLGHVLNAVLAGHGYAIAYDGGRPIRLTLTTKGAKGPPGQPWMNQQEPYMEMGAPPVPGPDPDAVPRQPTMVDP